VVPDQSSAKPHFDLIVLVIAAVGIKLSANFLYSGWDTAAYVSEETKGKKAGSAAVTSVVILFVIYSVVILAFQGVAPNKAIRRSTTRRITRPSCSAC
jgi:amino acid transporter